LIAPSIFAIASRDELWMHGALVESRLMHGRARQRGDEIEASDARDDSLVGDCDDALDATRPLIEEWHDARVRVVVRATRENDTHSVETTMTVAMEGISVVTTPENAVSDYEMLRGVVGKRATSPVSSLPIVWQNGSAAVLLHEAVGHASEHNAARVSWPVWLSVDAPLVLRRETFRDVPLPRMRHVIARQVGAPFELREQRIEVHLIAGGGYDPLTDIVTINVAVSTTGPFTIRRGRAEIAASIRGAAGEPLRYPGVICSREGQELYVASHAPVMITDALL